MPDKLGAEYSCSLCSSLLQPRLFATSETRRGLAKCVPQLFPESLPGTRRSAIRHFYISHNAPYLPPAPCPKFCITYVFHFSWLLQPSQEEIENNAYAIFFFLGGGGGIRCIMGNLEVAYWPFIFLSLVTVPVPFSLLKWWKAKVAFIDTN